MAHFKSVEELLALRPKTNAKTNNSTREDLSRVREVLSQPDLNVKTYKFKRVKNSNCGWEVDYQDQKVDVPNQIDLTKEEDND